MTVTDCYVVLWLKLTHVRLHPVDGANQSLKFKQKKKYIIYIYSDFPTKSKQKYQALFGCESYEWGSGCRRKHLFWNQLHVFTPFFCRCLPTKQPPLNWFGSILEVFLFFFFTLYQADSSVKVHWDMTQIQTLWNSLPQLASLVKKKEKKSSMALFSFLDLSFSTSWPRHQPNIPYLQRWQQQRRVHRRLIWTPEGRGVAGCHDYSLNPPGKERRRN